MISARADFKAFTSQRLEKIRRDFKAFTSQRLQKMRRDFKFGPDNAPFQVVHS